MLTLNRDRRKRINYKIHTIGPFPFHKDRAGSVISLKSQTSQNLHSLGDILREVKRGHLFQKHTVVNWDVKTCS